MPQHKRGPWSQNEDSFLMSLVQTYTPSNWVRISQAIQTRTPKQCRERYHQNLKPSLNHEPITPEEGLIIEQMVHDMGKRWAEIARRLNGRSDNAVKNWWNGGMNRRRRGNHGAALMNRRSSYDVPTSSPQAHLQQTYPNSAHSTPVATHQQQHAHLYQQSQQQHCLTAQQQPLQSGFPSHLYGMPAYHGQMAQSVRMPPSAGGLRPHPHALVETPLPSPSAYSADGAPPSLISDSSSMSTRSPHSGTSPVYLPPLGAAGSDARRHSAVLPLGVPTNPYDTGYQMHLHAPVDKRASYPPQQQQHHHASFIPQHQYPQAAAPQYQHVPAPQQYMPRGPMDHPAERLAVVGPAVHVQYGLAHNHHHHHQHQQATQAPPPPPPQHLLPSQPIQLPSIASLPHSGEQQQCFDPSNVSHGRVGETPAPYGQSPDGSPRDKMSLSNLTH